VNNLSVISVSRFIGAVILAFIDGVAQSLDRRERSGIAVENVDVPGRIAG